MELQFHYSQTWVGPRRRLDVMLRRQRRLQMLPLSGHCLNGDMARSIQARTILLHFPSPALQGSPLIATLVGDQKYNNRSCRSIIHIISVSLDLHICCRKISSSQDTITAVHATITGRTLTLIQLPHQFTTHTTSPLDLLTY